MVLFYELSHDKRLPRSKSGALLFSEFTLVVPLDNEEQTFCPATDVLVSSLLVKLDNFISYSW